MTRIRLKSAQAQCFGYFMAVILMFWTSGLTMAAESEIPEGTKGWAYFKNGSDSLNAYAATAEEACRLSAQNHVGKPLLYMTPEDHDAVRCFYSIAGLVHSWWTTTLYCESGRRPTPEGLCPKTYEPPPPPTCKAGEPGETKGNPVMVSTGAKVQQETDLVGTPSGTLKVERTYRVYRAGSDGQSGGVTWSFSFDNVFKISQSPSDNRPVSIEVTLGDGTYLDFRWKDWEQKYESISDTSATVEPLAPSFEEWLLVYRDRAYRYKKMEGDSGARVKFLLVSSQTLNGPVQYYTYDSGLRLKTISNGRDRALEVTWTSDAIRSIKGPEGSVRYSYDWIVYGYNGQEVPFTKRLIAVEFFDHAGLSAGGKRYHYEDKYNRYLLTGVIDENDNRFATYAYDDYGRTVLSEHAGGANRHTFAYPDDKTRVITDALGAQRTLGLKNINGVGVVTGATQPGGSGCTPGAKSITHDSSGITSQTDFNGNKTCFKRDPSRGLEVSQVSGLAADAACPYSADLPLTEKSARQVRTKWHPDFAIKTAVAEPNLITDYLYNGQRAPDGAVVNCSTMTLPNGKPLPVLCRKTQQETTDSSGNSGFSAVRIGSARSWNYTYDANGQLLTSTGPGNPGGQAETEVRTYHSDSTANHAPGDLATITTSTGEITHYLEYNGEGLPTKIRRPNGQSVTLRYGARQRLVGILTEDGGGINERSEFEYDGVGSLIRATDPDGSSTTYAYDAAHRLIDVTDGAGNRTHFDLDGMGNVVQEEVYGPNGGLAWKRTRSFDLLSRLQREQDALQQLGTTFEYDRNGNLTKLIDQLGRTASTQYDGFNRRVRDTLPAPSTGSPPSVIDYTYNQQDQVAMVRDPRGLMTRYTMNGFRQTTALSSPDTGGSSAAFDGAGNLTSLKDARGVVTTYEHDGAERVTRAGSSSYEYGRHGTAEAGRLTLMRDESGQTAFSYDGFGRLLAKSQTAGSDNISRTFSLRYTYGAKGVSTGHVTSLTYPSGNRIEVGYDTAGRPSSLALVSTGAAAPVPLVTDIRYHPLGAVSSWTWGNATLSNPNPYARVFDLEGRITSYPLGHPGSNGVLRTLQYDAAGRIAAASHTGNARATALDQRYDYDGLDRLTSFDSVGTNQRYRYDSNGNRYEATFGGSTYKNTISTASNRLSATTGPAPPKSNTYDAAGNLTGDGTIRYTYGANGRMESATRGSVTMRYRYNGRGERLLKSAPAGTIFYLYDEQGHLLGEYDTAGKPLQETVYLGDLPIAVLTPGPSGPGVHYVYADHLLAPRVLTRASDNKMVWRWDQADPFGLYKPDENPAGLGKFTFNPRFPGQLFDAETNNHYNYYRDYDPQIGQYLQSDPIGLDGGINTYSYVRGNPISFVDPDGLQVWARPNLPARVAQHNRWTDPNRQLLREFGPDVFSDGPIPFVPNEKPPPPTCTMICPSHTPHRCPGLFPTNSFLQRSPTGEVCDTVCQVLPSLDRGPVQAVPTPEPLRARSAHPSDWYKLGRMVVRPR